ncbi:MAG: sulfatase-like hydrolase/transferase [Saprospiraceae bacterium]|nr:sulfatase-like hydrolase/transferase [Saprospiraceae bacterium]
MRSLKITMKPINLKVKSHLLLVSTSFWSLLWVSCNSPEVARPNILLIMTDQQPVSCVGAYGNTQIKTPNLDYLADEGHLFNNFYIAAFPCSPSRATILSGRYLLHHNVWTNNVQMDSTIPTMGMILAQAGYRTGYFGKAHLSGSMYVGRSGGDGIDYLHPPGGPLDPLGDNIRDYWHYKRIETDSGWALQRFEGGSGEDQAQLGFETWNGGWRNYKDWLLQEGKGDFARVAGNHDDFQSAPEGEHMYSQLGEEYHMAKFFTDKVNSFIQQKSQQPWAAVLSYFGPHLPVAPPRPWDTVFAIEDIQLPGNFSDDLEDKPLKQYQISSGYFQQTWTDHQFKDYIRRYWGYCGYIDAQIGRVFSLLKQLGQWDNTMVIFTSDHGDMLAGHGMIFKLGMNGYEELFRVPAIFKLPNHPEKGRQSEALTSSIDILPTILHTAHVDLPDGIDGKNLVPLFDNFDKHFREYIFSEIHSTGTDGKTIMCRNNQFKFVYHWLSQDVDELYDLVVDPGELNNLIRDTAHTKTRQLMQEAIYHWVDDTGHRYADLIKRKGSKNR